MSNEQQAIFTVFKDMISEIKELKEENKELRRALGSNTEALGKSPTRQAAPRAEQKPPEDRVTGKG
jgi:regulator of replication initiation timing